MSNRGIEISLNESNELYMTKWKKEKEKNPT